MVDLLKLSGGNEVILEFLKEQLATAPSLQSLPSFDEPQTWATRMREFIEKGDSSSPGYVAARLEMVAFADWLEKVLALKSTLNGPLEEIKTFALDMRNMRAVAGKVPGISKDGIEPLATVLQEQISSLLPELGGAEPSFTDEILTWDSVFFKRLESLSDDAKTFVTKKARPAAVVRRKQWDADHKVERLWKIWEPTAFHFADTLAKALWPAVKERVEKAREKPAALTMLIHDSAMQLLTQNFKQQEDKNGQRAIVFPDESILRIVTDAATIGTETLDALMVQKGVELFGTIASHKVFRWQIFTGHRQVLERNPDPRILRIEGGWEYFADMLSMSKKQAKQLEQIIEAQHATTLLLPGQSKPSRLLMREYLAQRGRGKAEIRLILGTALLPDFVGELKSLKCREVQDWKRLVPITDLPPIVGRANEAGGQASLSLLSVCYMRKNAAGLVQQGGVDLLKELPRLAAQAGVPQHMIPAIVDKWEQGDDERPAFLLRVNGNLHTLGEAHKTQRDFIEEGGRKELQGSKAGKKGVAKRREVLRRKGT